MPRFRPVVRRIMQLGGGKAGVYAVRIPQGATCVGLSIRDVDQHHDFPKECAFMGIYDEGDDNFLIPRGDYVLQEGHTLFLVSKTQFIKQATDFLRRTK